MAKGRGITKNGRSKIDTYFKMFHYVYDTAAYAALSCVARTVLFELFRRHNGSNNGSIMLPARGFERFGISRSTISRAIKELIRVGLVTVETPSAFTVKNRRAAEYALAWLPVGKRPATTGFRSYVPHPEIKYGPTGGTKGTDNHPHSPTGDQDWVEMERAQSHG